METGVPGLLIALWAAVAALGGERRNPWVLAAVAAVLMHTFVDFDLQIPRSRCCWYACDRPKNPEHQPPQP